MTNRIRTGIALLILSHGLVGCADQGSPTAPSAPPPPSVQQPSPQQPTGIQPSITAIAPQVGSTRGGAWATITGVDFQPGAKVRLGDTTVSSWTRDSTTISVWGTAAHAAGTIDVIVTNPGGLEARLSGGYTFRVSPNPSISTETGWPMPVPNTRRTCDSPFGITCLSASRASTSAPMTFAPAPSVRMASSHFSATTASRSPACWCRPSTRSARSTCPLAKRPDGGLIRVALAAGSRYAYARR